MTKSKVVIIDDDMLSVESLQFELEKDNRFVVEGIARNGHQGRKLIEKIQPDLLFLDIELPDQTGMDLLHEIRKILSWDMRSVFYTAYDKYMIQAIRESAFDYLLKPFTEQDLKEMLDRFIADTAVNHTVQPFVTQTSSVGQQTFIVYTPTNDMRVLRIGEIGYFRYCSESKIWEVIASNNTPLALRRGVNAEQILQYSPNFIQIHQSFIVNIDYLMLIRDSKCVMFPPFDKVSELVVSRKFKKELQQRFCL